ncbi:alpha/beta hydrolase fold domain-containing protein [Oceanivirga salmonicida]|uniref:alpha/beta hydrolase fold domain-containing protein n=1 Tax=Oceanivirga salmonicida TaxID=1769291 RepID=UPI000832B971|nr:alpha/beta hydrolase fold domain-containing protein [Oceanivirga salmonicida]
MDIKEEMLYAQSRRNKDEFSLGEDLIIDGIDLGKMRSMIGYRGLDLAKEIKQEKININGIDCYKYYNNLETKNVLFYIHGGGFYGGAAIVMEYLCKYFAKVGNMHVINIDYTLAPKSKFPDTSIEIYNIIKKVSSMYKNVKFSVAGDSAGAHLAMNTALLDIKDENLLSFVTMYYPVISLDEIKNWNMNMYNLEDPCPNGKMVIRFLKSVMPYIQKFYVPENTDKNNSMYDLKKITSEELEKLPKMLVVKSEFDYFNPEIDEFCKKCNIKSYEYKGLSHGFMEFLGYLDEVSEIVELTVNKINNN